MNLPLCNVHTLLRAARFSGSTSAELTALSEYITRFVAYVLHKKTKIPYMWAVLTLPLTFFPFKIQCNFLLWNNFPENFQISINFLSNSIILNQYNTGEVNNLFKLNTKNCIENVSNRMFIIKKIKIKIKIKDFNVWYFILFCISVMFNGGKSRISSCARLSVFHIPTKRNTIIIMSMKSLLLPQRLDFFKFIY